MNNVPDFLTPRLHRFAYAMVEPGAVQDWCGFNREFASLTVDERAVLIAGMGEGGILWFSRRNKAAADDQDAEKPLQKSPYQGEFSQADDGQWQVFLNQQWRLVVEPHLLDQLNNINKAVAG